MPSKPRMLHKTHKKLKMNSVGVIFYMLIIVLNSLLKIHTILKQQREIGQTLNMYLT